MILVIRGVGVKDQLVDKIEDKDSLSDMVFLNHFIFN